MWFFLDKMDNFIATPQFIAFKQNFVMCGVILLCIIAGARLFVYIKCGRGKHIWTTKEWKKYCLFCKMKYETYEYLHRASDIFKKGEERHDKDIKKIQF